MSPEINGNPPSVTKRKKNREKKPQTDDLQNFDLNMPSCNYFPIGQLPYPNHPMPEMTNYYPYMNYTNPTEPMSLPVYPINYPGYMTCPGNMMGSTGNVSRHSTLSNHTFNLPNDTREYISLPVVSNDFAEDSKRRFSDPGLPNDSDSGSNSCDETVQKLTRQINALKESNNRLSREVMELRIEMNLIKQHQASRHYEREYEPGMLVDVIREVREAARVREDALLARVKHIMEEKHLNVNQLSMVSEKNRNNDRISKLEDQLKSLSVSNNCSRSLEATSALNCSSLTFTDEKNKSARQVIDLEREALELRRELQDTRAKKDEADQKVLKLSNMLRRSDASISEPSDDGKTSVDSLSTVTTITSSIASPRVVLSGPVTSL